MYVTICIDNVERSVSLRTLFSFLSIPSSFSTKTRSKFKMTTTRKKCHIAKKQIQLPIYSEEAAILMKTMPKCTLSQR